MTDNLELEVKFFVPDLVAMRQKLLTLGAVIKKPRIYERNVRYDTPDEALRGRRELLRQCVPNEVGFQMTPLPDHRSEPLAQLGPNRRFYPGRAAGRQRHHHNGDKVFARRCVRR